MLAVSLPGLAWSECKKRNSEVNFVCLTVGIFCTSRPDKHGHFQDDKYETKLPHYWKETKKTPSGLGTDICTKYPRNQSPDKTLPLRQTANGRCLLTKVHKYCELVTTSNGRGEGGDDVINTDTRSPNNKKEKYKLQTEQNCPSDQIHL